MGRFFSIFLMAVTLLGSGSAFAWGPKGHAYVGAIADDLLASTRAGTQVRSILGYDLATAAKWADCVRSVAHSEEQGFHYVRSRYTAPCHAFETQSEQARMIDYASRNWDNCPNRPGHGCHEMYHFADVDTAHDHYARQYAGTSDHDIVSAIDAAVAVLKGDPAPAPFSIKDKKEALLMIAHFVGDLHQPLHVGALYLDAHGNRVDADAPGTDLDATETHGANLIADGSTNLHSEWDDIPSGLGTVPTAAVIAAAKRVPATSGSVDDFAATWASDTVIASHTAFDGMTFSGDTPHHWTASFENRHAYLAAKRALQTVQVEKAGAHLAELLKDVWPTAARARSRRFRHH